MAAETMKVIPSALLRAAASAATLADRAAARHPGAVLTASPGSPADAAVGTVAAGMSTRTAQLSAALAGKGPQVQATTQAGVAQLQAQDDRNAAQIQQLGDGAQAPDGVASRGGIQAVGYGTPRPQAPTPDPGLPQPPGGWSDDPVMEDAQRIAYGHAWKEHATDFPGITQDQLADLVHGMLTGDPKTDPDLYVGQTPRGSTAIYKNGVLVLYDPSNTGDLGTVFKPDHGFDEFLQYTAPHAPIIGAPPNLPPVLEHPAVAPPLQPGHPAPTAIPPTVLDHPPLPPWLQNPSPPGFDVRPGEPPLFAPLDIAGDTAPSELPGGPPVTIHLPPMHAPDVQLSPDQQQSLETGLGVAGILGLLLIIGLPVGA